jgi:hypothetical protein
MKDKYIYILLTDTGTWFSRLVKIYTKAPYNPTSISLDDNLEELYSFGRKVYHNPLSAGFVKESLNQGVYHYKKNTKCILYKIAISHKQYDEILRKLDEFKCSPKHYRYNLLGVMGIALGKRIIRDNAFTCSQFVASVLTTCGIYAFEKYTELITPEDISKIPQLQIIYEGKLSDYKQDQAPIYNPNLLSWNQYKVN